MKTILRANPLILVTLLLLNGCVTHSLFIDLTSESKARYVIEGDSLDVYDGRLRMPFTPPWTLVEKKTGMDADSSLTVTLDYMAPLSGELSHPLTPRDLKGTIQVVETKGLLFNRKTLTVLFPSWDVLERFGDPEAFIPEEVNQLEEVGADTLLSPDRQDQLKRMKAIGMQKATAQRYLKQEQALVQAYFRQSGEPLPDSVMSDAMARFSPVLQVHLMTLRNHDPLDVSLEWYETLRQPMIDAAVEATGGDPEWFAAQADTLDLIYKSWLDLEDDAIQVKAILPAWRVVSNADSVSSDTLLWELETDILADSTVTLSAVGITPIPLNSILALLILLSVVVALLIRALRRRSLPQNRE